jgi:hypothetical protein
MPVFQLDHMPYVVEGGIPMIVISNDNYAYLRVRNALLRYKLPDGEKSN